MASQNPPTRKSSRPDTIVCPNCNEVYSTTYRRCPFCKELARPTSTKGTARSAAATSAAASTAASQGERRTRSSAATGSRGRRVARTTRGGGYGKPAYLNQIIFFAVTLALIIAACFVIGKVVGPLLGRDTEDDPTTSTSTPAEDTDTTTDTDVETTVPDIVIPAPTTTVTSISLSHSDVTLGSGESFTLKPTLTPSDSSDTVVWTTDSSAATVSLAGLVTNTNTGSGTVAVTITATVGDVSAQCIVRCKSVSSSSSTTTTTATPGSNATVTGASAGLNVRSGPSTSDSILASLGNGSAVTILSTPSADWYEISFYDESGTLQTGYVSSSYIRAN